MKEVCDGHKSGIYKSPLYRVFEIAQNRKHITTKHYQEYTKNYQYILDK